MRQRGRQLAHQRDASQVGELAALLRRTRLALPERGLGPASPAALDQQPEDQRRLQQEHAEGREDGRPVALPERRRAEEDLGVRRKAVLGQAPALQLPPIDDQRGGGHLRGGHRLARRSPKDTHEEATRARAVVREIHHATTDDPVADPVARDPVHGRRRHACEAGDEVPGIELPSALVPREGREDHERSRRDATETVDERFVGPILQHLQLHPVQERGDLAQRHGKQEGVHAPRPRRPPRRASHPAAAPAPASRSRRRATAAAVRSHSRGGRRNQRSARRPARTRSVRPERG